MGHQADSFSKGAGCRSCRNTGYKGRLGVHELLLINDELRDAIVADPSINNLRRLALAGGMIDLAHDGFRKVREGLTTIEEVLHIAGDLYLAGTPEGK